MAAGVTLENIVKTYKPDAPPVVRGVSLEIKPGELFILLGPSGCGKSTLLRMIAGLEEITSGTLKIGDRVVNDVPPKDRDMAMVFQSYALYPHMTVLDNMAFGLKLRRVPKAEIDKRTRAAAESLGLETRSAPARASSPAASASASPSGARSCASRPSSCSTSRSRTSTPSCAAACEPS